MIGRTYTRRRRLTSSPAPAITMQPIDAGSGTVTSVNPTPSGLATSLSPNDAAKVLSDAISLPVSADEFAPKFCASSWKSPKLIMLPYVKFPSSQPPANPKFAASIWKSPNTTLPFSSASPASVGMISIWPEESPATIPSAPSA